MFFIPAVFFAGHEFLFSAFNAQLLSSSGQAALPDQLQAAIKGHHQLYTLTRLINQRFWFVLMSLKENESFRDFVQHVARSGEGLIPSNAIDLFDADAVHDSLVV
jgi:hypothetical protein